MVTSEAHEAIEYGLMEAGALGTETDDADSANVIVNGYFDHNPATEMVRAALVDALRIYNLAQTSLIDLRVSEIADRDWLAEWKKDWQPVEVGRFIIAPPWSEPPSPRGEVDAGGPLIDRIIIRI